MPRKSRNVDYSRRQLQSQWQRLKEPMILSMSICSLRIAFDRHDEVCIVYINGESLELGVRVCQYSITCPNFKINIFNLKFVFYERI